MGGSNPINHGSNPPPDSLIDNGYRDACYSGDSWLPEAPPPPAGQTGPPYPNSFSDLMANLQAQCSVAPLFTPANPPAGLLDGASPFEVIPYADMAGTRVLAGGVINVPASGSVRVSMPNGSVFEVGKFPLTENTVMISSVALHATDPTPETRMMPLRLGTSGSYESFTVRGNDIIFDPQPAHLGPDIARVTLGNGEVHFYRAGATIPVTDGATTVVFGDGTYSFVRGADGSVQYAGRTGGAGGGPFERIAAADGRIVGVKFAPASPSQATTSPPYEVRILTGWPGTLTDGKLREFGLRRVTRQNPFEFETPEGKFRAYMENDVIIVESENGSTPRISIERYGSRTVRLNEQSHVELTRMGNSLFLKLSEPQAPSPPPPATPPAPPAAPPAPPSSPPVDPAQPVSGATPVIVLDGSRASWLLTFEEGQVRRVRVGTDFIDVKLENGCFQAQRVGYEHRGFEPLESFGFSRFEARTGAIQTPGGVRQTIQFVRAGLPQFDLGQNIRPSGMPFRIAGSDLVFKISRTSGPMEISMEGPTTHQILFLERESTSLSLGNGLVVRKVGASVVIESTVPPAAAIPAAPAAAQPVPAAPAQPAAAAPQLPTATVCLTAGDQTVTIEGRSYIVRPGVNGNGSDVVLVMSASDGARVSVNPNSQNYFMSGGKKIVVTWDAATGEVTITQVPSSQGGRGPNDNPPLAPAGGGSAGVTSAAPSSGGVQYAAALDPSAYSPFGQTTEDEDYEPLYGVSWGMPFEPAPATATAGYAGDVCWTPGLDPVAVGAGASGGSRGVGLFDGYSYYVGESSTATEMVSRPGSPLPPPAESAGVGSRAMTMARGFGAGFGVMTALNEVLDLTGMNDVPVVRHPAGAGVFLAGHFASVSATTELTFAEAAANPISLAEGIRVGARFNVWAPLIHSLMSRVGFTREALPEGFWGDVAYQGGPIAVAMLADVTAMSTFEALGMAGAGELVAGYGLAILGYNILADMQSLIMPDAIGMEEDIRVAQILNGVATCSVTGDSSMRECTEDDWWEARHTIQGAMPQYVDQLTAAEEQVHGQMNAEALAGANNLRTVFSAMLAERLSMEAMAYDGSTEPLTTSDRLAAMLQDIISSGLPSMPSEPVYPTLCNGMDDDCDSNFDDQTDYALMPAYEAAVASYPGDLAEYNRVTSNYNTLKNILTEEENRGKNLAEIKDLFVGALVSERHISESEALPQFEETLNVFMGEQFKILAEAKTPFGGEAIFPVIGTALVESGPVDESEKIADYLMYQPIGETSIGAMSEVMDAAADIAREAYMMNYENGMVELVGDTWVVMPSYIPTADDRNDWRVIELTADDPLYAQGYSYMINPDYTAYKILDNSGVLNTSQG